MRDQISIRAASENDVVDLLDLYEHLSSDSEQCSTELAKKNIVDLAKYDGSAVLIGEIGGQIATTCTLIVIPNLTRQGMPYALIENVVTHPEHRGKGFGKLILEAASERAWRHDCYKIMLSTGSRKPATLSFYERAGFEQSRTGFQKRRIAPRLE
jgi:GNAT superfamily N-acetyltransferase